MPPSGDEHSDDDIVVGRAQVSLRCPLTTVLLENPVTRYVSGELLIP
jgi:hypothetical protein